MKLIYFNSILETILKDMSKDYPTILIGNFNINVLKKHVNQQHFKSYVQIQIEILFFFETTTINNTH